MFSKCVGNIYTPPLLLQRLQFVYGDQSDCLKYWEKDGCIFDPSHMAIEPDGFADLAEFQAAQQTTYRALRNKVEQASVVLIVSPVSLTAMATVRQALSATGYSRSVLRAELM